LASPGPRVYGPRPAPFALTTAQVIYLEQRLVTCPDMRGKIKIADQSGEIVRGHPPLFTGIAVKLLSALPM
jgi:hypothetical protein